MVDFSTYVFELNTGTNTSPTWTTLLNFVSLSELRFSDRADQGTTPGASWPNMTRPAVPTLVNYQYAFTTDTGGLGYLGNGTAVPVAWSNANQNDCRWRWDNLGTFASVPIYTCYASSAHNPITPGDGTLLGGSTDTGNRSYVKANLFGQVSSAGTPPSAPTNPPLVTDGTTGNVSPSAGSSWATHYQDLQGDNDFLSAAAVPAATTADSLQMMLTMFAGPAQTTGLVLFGISTKYTFF